MTVLLRKDRYDLIISNVKMPGMEGPTCEKEMRAMDPELAERIIFITGDLLSTTTQAFLEERGGGCLRKPFELEELTSLAKRALSDDERR